MQEIPRPDVPPWWKAAWDGGLMYMMAIILYVIFSASIAFGTRLVFRHSGPDEFQYNYYAVSFLVFELALLVVLLAYPLWPPSSKAALLSWDQLKNKKWILALATAVTALMFAVDMAYQVLFHPQASDFVNYLIYAMGTASAPVIIVAGALIAPFYEELMFRGFFQSAFEKTLLGFWGSALLLATFWSLVHFHDWGQTIILIIHGLLLAGLRRCSGSLIPSIISHSFFNTVVFLYYVAYANVQS